MRQTKVASRYAKGFMSFLESHPNKDAIIAEFADFRNLLSESRELTNFLNSPIIDSRKKQNILSEIFKNKSKEFQNMLNLVVQQGRENNLLGIAYAVEDMHDKEKGVKHAKITSARPLDQDQIENILKKVHEHFPQKITIKYTTEVDPSLVSGFTLRVDELFYDASTKTKFNKIRQNFDSKLYYTKL
ncbi:MAG: ATP synthase F1 subunit delta [Weeksellaceae bacterium]|nr:ATP synthase F1 subunit delta [Weeksellaceae bacterium]